MATTTDDVVMGDTGIDPEAGSQTADASRTGSATEGDTSDGDEKFVPLSRFKEVIDQRNNDRETLNKLRTEHDQTLTWIHQKVVPALEKMEAAGASSMADSADSDVYVDPLEAKVQAQRAEIDALKTQIDSDRNQSFTRNFEKSVEKACAAHELSSPAEVVDQYLRNPSESFDFEAAAKRSHQAYERKFDGWNKRRAAAARAKRLNESSPAALAGVKPPKNSAEARAMAREYFRNQQK